MEQKKITDDEDVGKCQTSRENCASAYRNTNRQTPDERFRDVLCASATKPQARIPHVRPPHPIRTFTSSSGATMARADDLQSSDILGSRTPLGPGRVPQSSFSWRLVFFLALGGLAAFHAFRTARAHFLRWKERRYKLYAYQSICNPRADGKLCRVL